MSSNLQRYVPEDHPAVRILWRRVVAAHHSSAKQGGAIDYLMGMRDGYAEAYATITGIPRQDVGDRARAARES